MTLSIACWSGVETTRQHGGELTVVTNRELTPRGFELATGLERDKRDYHDLFPIDLAGRPRHLTTQQPTDLISIPSASEPPATSTISVLELIPEEQVWLDGLKTANTRRAYQNDVIHFARLLGISSSEELYAADHRAVTYWEKHLREFEGLEPSTIRRRLSALSSLFTHLYWFSVTLSLGVLSLASRNGL